MNEPEKQILNSTTEEKPASQVVESTQVLSPRRRTALVAYLSILFAVAFLFVAITMALESKRMKSIYEALENSSQKTSASLTNSINALQAENELLSKSNEELTGQIEEKKIALTAAEEEKQGYLDQIEQLNAEKAALEAEKAELETQYAAQIQELTQQAEDAVKVSELLQTALVYKEVKDTANLNQVLTKIEALKDYLSPSEKDIYERLKAE